MTIRACVLLLVMLAFGGSVQAQFGTKASGAVRARPVPIREYQRFDPPAHYRQLYADAITCSGAYGNIPLFTHVVWLQAPGGSFMPPLQMPDRLPLRGLWQGGGGPPDTIVIAADLRNMDWLVKHELIHYVLQQDHFESKAADDSLWGRACQAKAGFLSADTVPSKPGRTYLYR